MKAIAYVRVSTIEQADEGVSVDAQQATVRAYCTLRGLELAEIIVDAAVSGGKTLESREGGKRILEAVRKRRVQAVVACKLDRLFRDAGDCLNTTKEWDRAGVALHLIDVGGQTIDTSSTMGRFFLTVMAGCAEMERGLIRDRTKAAMNHKRRNRERISGRIPFGWRLDADGVSLVDDPYEQGILAEIAELRGSGHSLREIAAELNGRKVPAKNGKQWVHTSVKAILSRNAA